MGKPRQTTEGSEFFKPKAPQTNSRGASSERSQMEGSGYSKGETAILEAIQTLHSKVDKMESRMATMEENFTSLKNRIAGSEEKLKGLEDKLDIQEESIRQFNEELGDSRQTSENIVRGQVKLEKRIESLEDSIRANNLRILGIPATEEGDDLVSFLGPFLSSILDVGEGGDPPLVIKAFRLSSRSRKWSEIGGGTVMAVLADVAERDRLLNLARKKKHLFYKEQKILIFPDVGPASQERRVQLLKIRKEMIHRGFSASLLYPAKLRVQSGDKTYIFNETQAARDFLEKTPDDIQP